MKNYLDEIYTVSQFKENRPELAEMAERAVRYLKGYIPLEHFKTSTYIIIEVDTYLCVATTTSKEAPYELYKFIAPFDKDKIYPLQEILTQFTFKQYH